MKVVLAGAYGNLGSEIFKCLLNKGHEVLALDIIEKDLGINGNFTFKKIDVTNPSTLVGLMDNADVVISTVGLTTKSATTTNYEVDFNGNLNLLNEAKKANVKSFVYISVIKADEGKYAPMVHAKYLFEEELKKSNINYVIHRPTGYFYDIIKVFKKMIDKGSVTLLGKKAVSANVVDTKDFAMYIVEHMLDKNVTYNIGGKETWTYEEIANMCFKASNKKPIIKKAPVLLFDILASLPKNKKDGTSAIIKFSKFTLTNDMIGDIVVGESSFKEYVNEFFKN